MLFATFVPRQAPGKRLGRWGFFGVVTVLCAEVASGIAGHVMQSRGLLYATTRDADLVSYLAERDPDLGWPNPMGRRPDLAPASLRAGPAVPDPTTPPCASIYGDSFALGEEVDDEHAWSTVLSQRLGCRVANYGVGGFGPDQAYLRYARSTGDRAKVVILTHLSENILRNVNRLRNLLAPTQGVALKPRFVIGASGEIERLPLFTPRSDAEMRVVMDHPEALLRDEWFTPGGPAGVSTLTFPYLFSVARAFRSFRVRAALAGRPSHAEFYEPEHPARGLQISAAIARAFAREAASRGASPLFVIIPLAADLAYKRKSGKWSYSTLVDELTRTGVPFLDTGDRFEAELHDANPCSLYIGCAGHFNERGNRLLAEYVHEWLARHGQLSR